MGNGSAISVARPRWRLRENLPQETVCHGNQGSSYCPKVTVAGWLCGTCHRVHRGIYPAGPAGSCDCDGRGTFASAASRLCKLLQHLPHPSRVRQRHAPGPTCPTSWQDHTDTQTRRAPSCLCPNLIVDRDRPGPRRIAQGIGQALIAIYDDDSGQLVSGSFMDDAMPSSRRHAVLRSGDQ